MKFPWPLALLLVASAGLGACEAENEPSSAAAPEQAEPADQFLSKVRADYPVTLSPVSENVWVHTTHYTLPGQPPIPVNGLAVMDGDSITLIDGAWGELATVSLLETIRAETGKPVKRMIVTQHNANRTMGVDAAEREGVEVFTHPDTPMLAARKGYPVPNTSVAALADPYSRTRVGRVEVAFPGPGHTPDNLIAYIPDAKILYAGQIARGAEAKSLGNTADIDLIAWKTSLQWAKATYPEAKIVVPAHGKGADLSLLDATILMIDRRLTEDTAQDD